MSTPQRRPSLVPRWSIILAAVGAGLLAAAAVLLLLPSAAETRVVPSVSGLQIPVARSRLAQVGLFLEVGDQRFSATIPEGGVIEHSPGPGEDAEVGSVVTIIVSAGSERFSLPDVVGLPLESARTELEARGLLVEVQTTPSEDVPNTVLASVPAPGSEVGTSDTVRLTVATGGMDDDTLVPVALEGTTFLIDPTVADPTAPDVTMEIARRLRSLLEASGASVELLRSVTDTDTGPAGRVARGRQAIDVTAVLGIDVSAGPTSTVEVSTLSSSADTAPFYLASLRLAESLVDGLEAMEEAPEPIAVSEDPVLAAVQAPGVRVLLGSVLRPEDVAAFSDPLWVDRVTRVFYRSLAEAFAGS
jgi:hypothetical protein